MDEQQPTRRPGGLPRALQADASARPSGSPATWRKWFVLGITIGAVAGLGAVVFYLALRYTAGVSARRPGRLSPSDTPRGGWQPRIGELPAPVGDSVGDDGRGAGVGVHCGPARSGSHWPWHRRSHRGGAWRSARHPVSRSAGEDGGQRADHRVGRLGRPRRADGPNLGRIWPAADPATEPVRRGRPDRGGARHRGGHWRDLRRTPGRSGAGQSPPYRDDFDYRCLVPGFITSGTAYAVLLALRASIPCSRHRRTPSIASREPGRCCGSSSSAWPPAAVGDQRPHVPRLRRARPPAAGRASAGAGSSMDPGEVVGRDPPKCSAAATAAQLASDRGSLLQIPLWIVIVLPIAKIVATSLSIGTGGSGGLFGPGIVIGAFLGAAVWRLGELCGLPGVPDGPGIFVVVGTTWCFGRLGLACRRS